MSHDIRALEDRHDELQRDLDALLRSNQNRRGVLVMRATNIRDAPILLGFLIAGLLGAPAALMKAPRRPPPPTDCR
jgi:hypothetical protein